MPPMTRKTRIQPIEHAGEDADHGYDRPSKSQLKRDMHALQELGAALVELPKDACCSPSVSSLPDGNTSSHGWTVFDCICLTP